MLFFISFKGRSALACFPFEGEDFSWNVRNDPQTREGDAEEDQEQPAAVGWSFFSRVMVRNSSISAFNLNSERDEVVRVVAATPVQSALSPVEFDPPPPLDLPNPSKQPLDRCRVSCYVDGGCGGFPRRKPMNDLSVFIKLCRVLEMSVETSWGCTTVRRIAYASEDDGSQEGIGLSG